MNLIIKNFLIALTLTIWIEAIVAYLSGFKKKTELTVIALLNVITNLLLNCILLIANNVYRFSWSGWLLGVVILEIIIILIEWRVLVSVLGYNSRKMLVLSLVMNIASCLLGIIVFICRLLKL